MHKRLLENTKGANNARRNKDLFKRPRSTHGKKDGRSEGPTREPSQGVAKKKVEQLPQQPADIILQGDRVHDIKAKSGPC